MNFDTLFVNPNGRTARAQFVPALITLLAVVVFYAFVVKGRTAQFCLLVLLFPAIVLHARRLRDMGHSVWLLLLPALLMLVAFGIWLKYLSFGAPLDRALPVLGLVVSAGFALWGCIGAERGARPAAGPRPARS